MAVRNGTLMLLYIDGTAVAATKTCKLKVVTKTKDKTTKDSDAWDEHLLASRSWQMSFTGMYDPTGDVNIVQLWNLINTRAQCTAKISTEVNTDYMFFGTGSVTMIDMDFSMEQPMGISGTVKGDGGLTMQEITP